MGTPGEEMEAEPPQENQTGPHVANQEGVPQEPSADERHDAAMDPGTTDGEGEAATTSTEVVQPWDKVSQRIKALQQQRMTLKAQSKQAAKEMKKAQRQKRRTAKNAKKLSDEELVQIVMERRVQEQVAKQAKAAVSAASGSASGNGFIWAAGGDNTSPVIPNWLAAYGQLRPTTALVQTAKLD